MTMISFRSDISSIRAHGRDQFLERFGKKERTNLTNSVSELISKKRSHSISWAEFQQFTGPYRQARHSDGRRAEWPSKVAERIRQVNSPSTLSTSGEHCKPLPVLQFFS